MKDVLIVMLLFLSSSMLAQTPVVFQTSEGAINGYDPVAYFTEAKPVFGRKDISFNWNGATWYFSSEKNRQAFKDDPEKFAPQYGGYCAYGTAESHKSPTQPDAWTIVNGMLYLNYNSKVKATWEKDRPNYIEKANLNWPKIKDTQ